jgi:hypothetical protein
LSGEDLCVEFPAVLAGHGAFEAFHDRAHGRVVCGELFGAILNGDVGSDASVFVVSYFVGFLESPPPAHVVDEDRAKLRVPALDDPQEVLECVAALDADAAFAGVDEGPNGGDAVCVCVSLDEGVLVFCGVLLVVRGHADVLGCLYDTARVVSGLARMAQRHNYKDRGRDAEQLTRPCVVAMNRRFLPAILSYTTGCHELPKRCSLPTIAG